MLQRIHGGGMEGDVAGKKHKLQAALLQCRHDRLQFRFLSTDNHACWCVFAGDLHPGSTVSIRPEGDIQLIQKRFHP